MDDGILEGLELICFLGKTNGKFADIRLPGRQFKLLDKIDLSYNSLSECIENLVKLGMVKIKRNYLYLTPAGKSIYEMVSRNQ